MEKIGGQRTKVKFSRLSGPITRNAARPFSLAGILPLLSSRMACIQSPLTLNFCYSSMFTTFCLVTLRAPFKNYWDSVYNVMMTLNKG